LKATFLFQSFFPLRLFFPSFLLCYTTKNTHFVFIQGLFATLIRVCAMSEAIFLSQLQEIASSGSVEALLGLLRNEPLVPLESSLTEQGSTALMILAAMGRHDLIDVLLQETPPLAVDQTNKNGTTALVFACSMGHLSAVKVLCERGADVNWAIGSLDTPLTVAAEEGFDDIVSYLSINRHAKLESTNESGQTALLCACDQGRISTIALLLDCGANLEAADKFQATPLIVACSNGFVDIARVLLQRGASTTCVSEAILTMKCDREATDTGIIDAIKAALIALLSSYSWYPALDFQRSCQQNDVVNVKRLMTAYPLLSEAVYARCLVYGGWASPLMVACLHNALKVVKFLVTEYPFEENAAREDGRLIDGSSLIEVTICLILLQLCYM
jgi:ankyrin repeat protein